MTNLPMMLSEEPADRGVPVGTEVWAWPGDLAEPPTHTRTRSAPWVLGDGKTWVIAVDGRAGGIALSHVARYNPTVEDYLRTFATASGLDPDVIAAAHAKTMARNAASRERADRIRVLRNRVALWRDQILGHAADVDPVKPDLEHLVHSLITDAGSLALVLHEAEGQDTARWGRTDP